MSKFDPVTARRNGQSCQRGGCKSFIIRQKGSQDWTKIQRKPNENVDTNSTRPDINPDSNLKSKFHRGIATFE